MKTKEQNYAIIYFSNGRSIKRRYETASRAFYDYKEKGCISVELFNSRGVRLAVIYNPI